jgi:LmbE family N-acetylglucosaminyl deacetylase
VSKKICLTVLIASVAGACSAATEDVGVAPGDEHVATAEQSLFKDTPRVLTFVAHQDDDFMTMNPDLARNIQAPAPPARAIRTVVLTAGDAGLMENAGAQPCQSYVLSRAVGQKRAYEVMAGVNFGGNWGVPQIQTVAGHNVLVEKMPGKDITIIYLGFGNSEARVLENLWNQGITNPSYRVNVLDSRIKKVGNPGIPENYNRDELVEVLKALYTGFGPTHVNTLDSGKTYEMIGYPSEHSDHVHSALFALAATQRITPPPATMRLYRTYNAIFEVENVAAVDVALKHSLYEAYAPHDPFLCQGAMTVPFCDGPQICEDPANVIYGPFETVQYPIAVPRNVAGAIHAPGGQCLRANGTTAGSTLSVGSCAANLHKWSLPADGTLRLGALCVSSNTGSNPTPQQTRGAALRLEACSATENRQRFAVTGTGQLRGPDATCVSTANAAQLTLTECGNVANQLGFGVGFVQAPFNATNGTDFVVPNSPQYYHSLTYGDLDGDQDSDVCIRKSDGVWCATNNGANAFNAFARRTTAFRDADGYNSASTGGTLMLADIDGDLRADLCARKGGLFDSGVHCAKNTGTGAAFNPASKRTAGDAFSDVYGFDSSDVYYGSIRLTDANADGKLDVCARNSNGIECATGSGTGTFAAVSQRQSVEFTDLLGWNLSSAGTTIQFADIDGDGKTDVCGRGAAGIICMLGLGNTSTTSFDRPHIWSDTDDFSDGEGWSGSAAVYRSIRLGDINGDGLADVCGRKADGVWCGVSTGQAFATAKRMIPVDPYGDGSYGSTQFGASLALLRLDGGTHTDICLRGPLLAPGTGTGLRCSIAP